MIAACSALMLMIGLEPADLYALQVCANHDVRESSEPSRQQTQTSDQSKMLVQQAPYTLHIAHANTNANAVIAGMQCSCAVGLCPSAPHGHAACRAQPPVVAWQTQCTFRCAQHAAGWEGGLHPWAQHCTGM